MASTPVTAPSQDSQQPSPTPPEAKSPPPESKSAPPPEAKSPPPEVKSPPPEAKPPPPKASGTPPPSTTSPPQPPKPQPQPDPEPTPKPSSPPPTSLPTPSAPTAGNTTPRTPPPPSQNEVPSPPTPTNNNPISLPPPSQPKHTPSGELSPPPPHAPAHRTPSSSSTPSNDRSSLSPESDSITEKLPLIVGVAVGAGMLCVIMILVYVVCSKKKKKKGSHDQVQYYSDPRNGPKGYYDNGTEQQQNWYNNNNPKMMNQSPQGFMGPPGGGWPQRQSPSPQLSSGEMSSDPHHASIPSQSPGGNMGFSKSTFTYDELAAATNGFSQANLLGQGGFGYVHKGILPNGKVVAVKSLKSGSGQGEREFQAEVEIISRVHHRHLVSLVGYCIAGVQRMLVYEFVPNGTLEYHLYGKDCPTMEWHKRLTIALGSAKGLAYLHEDCHPRIIHRDIKAANILIDNNFEAMVADFGLAKLSQDNITHVSTRVMGTFGYLAPEYASSGKLSEKSDVFSFGVMLLELITGRKPVDTTNSYMDDSLVDWARPIMTQALIDGNFDELVDPLLKNIYNVNEMERMIACAAASIRHSSRRRPKMSQIVRALEGDASLEALNEGVLPGQSSAFASSSDSYDTTTYNADLKKFRKMALGGTSTEFSGVTSTYGLNPSSSSDSSYSGEVNHPGNTHPKN